MYAELTDRDIFRVVDGEGDGGNREKMNKKEAADRRFKAVEDVWRVKRCALTGW